MLGLVGERGRTNLGVKFSWERGILMLGKRGGCTDIGGQTVTSLGEREHTNVGILMLGRLLGVSIL